MSQEQSFPTTIGWDSFPIYLCYGVLDKTSQRMIKDRFVYDYLMNGKKVIEVRINENSSEIEEYWDGKYLGMSCYPDLKKTVYYHFSLMDPQKSPIHKEWVRSITTLGNVYVEFIDLEHVKKIVFPGVFVQDIYIPLEIEDTYTVDKIMSNELLKIFDCKLLDSVLTWKEKSSGKVIQKNIFLIKIQTPITFVFDIIKDVKSLIYKNKKWRIIVMLHNDFTNSFGIKNFFGTEKDDYSNYSILLK